MRTRGRKLQPLFRPGVLSAALLGLSLLAAACARDTGLSSGPGFGKAADDDTPPSWFEQQQELGKATYEEACASCHDSGEGGAPRTGRREDWAGRSDMWQAVLFNHAKSGYLDMPGKGGRPELSDQAVEAAAEYMLNRTFPELPRD